jgi:hypothetical protein
MGEAATTPPGAPGPHLEVVPRPQVPPTGPGLPEAVETGRVAATPPTGAATMVPTAANRAVLVAMGAAGAQAQAGGLVGLVVGMAVGAAAVVGAVAEVEVEAEAEEAAVETPVVGVGVVDRPRQVPLGSPALVVALLRLCPGTGCGSSPLNT